MYFYKRTLENKIPITTTSLTRAANTCQTIFRNWSRQPVLTWLILLYFIYIFIWVSFLTKPSSQRTKWMYQHWTWARLLPTTTSLVSTILHRKIVNFTALRTHCWGLGALLRRIYDRVVPVKLDQVDFKAAPHFTTFLFIYFSRLATRQFVLS